MVRVLVLYPGNVRFRQAQVATHKPLLDALGIELVLCDDYVDPTDREVFADVIELPPPTRVGEGLRRIEAALSRREAHAVVAQSESAACLGSLVARRIGALPLRHVSRHPQQTPRGTTGIALHHATTVDERVPRPVDRLHPIRALEHLGASGQMLVERLLQSCGVLRMHPRTPRHETVGGLRRVESQVAQQARAA